MSAVTSYQINHFGLVFECLSDFQAVHLDSAQLLLGSSKRYLLLLVNFLILEAFRAQKGSNQPAVSDASAIDCDGDESVKQGDDEFDEYRPY